MKYTIENLLTDEKIVCHEIRGTKHDNKEILLHFFITQKENHLPQFKMAYELYNPTSIEKTAKNFELHKNSPTQYALLSNEDNNSVIFGNMHIEKNEWTGEKINPLDNPNTDQVNGQIEVRYISEMADNSIYHEEIAIKQQEIIDENNHQINDLKHPTERTKEIIKNEAKNSHSIWTTPFHMEKFSVCSKEEMLELLSKYKPHINHYIPTKLDTESKLNIDMESIFGASFDVVRVKNNLFHKDITNPTTIKREELSDIEKNRYH